MLSKQSGDWSPRKIFLIIVLRKNILSYAAVTREFGGNVTKSEVEEFPFILSGNTIYTKQTKKRREKVQNSFL